MARIGSWRSLISLAAASSVPSPPTTTQRSAVPAEDASSEASIFLSANQRTRPEATLATSGCFGLVTMTTLAIFILGYGLEIEQRIPGFLLFRLLQTRSVLQES